jgi:diacylglycerol kinase family enzyme
MKTLIIYNPNSGKGKGMLVVEKIRQTKFFENQEVDVFELKDNSGDIFNKYKNESFDIVVAIGGDGTINTCVRFILENAPQAKLLIIPIGSSNSLAMSIGANLSLRKKIKKLNNSVCLQNKIIDIGEVNGRKFLVSVMLGYAAQVAGATKQKIKNRHGFFGYILNFFRYPRPLIYKFNISVDGESHDIEASTFSVLNAFSGVGGIPIRQKTSYDDGLLDVVFMRYSSFIGFLISVLFLFLVKANPKKKLKYFCGKEIILIKKDNGQKLPILIDGELTNIEEKEIIFRIIPEKLNIIV